MLKTLGSKLSKIFVTTTPDVYFNFISITFITSPGQKQRRYTV